MDDYFYKFLEPVSEEFAGALKELEGFIYKSPRAMLTHSRTFIEAIMEKVMIHEGLENQPYLSNIERIRELDENGLLTDEVRNALHETRKLGNQASHDTRQIRFSESLKAWEYIYIIVKWFVEVYESYEIKVPDYEDPVMRSDYAYSIEEMAIRIKEMEKLIRESLANEQPKGKKGKRKPEKKEQEKTSKSMNTPPGLMPIRTITYGDNSIDIPYFLRDAFLLPQRFEHSERFLVRLGAAEEARIMSELPSNLDGFHERVTHYNEKHTETFFQELKLFIDEEIRRKKLMESRPGELFIFYQSDQIVVTEEFGNVEINKDNFTGMPGLIDQLNKDGIYRVGDLPRELVIIGKYKQVGKTRVENFFNQLKNKQESMLKEMLYKK